MAYVKKCDRCGTVYDKNRSVRKLQVRMVEEHDTYKAVCATMDLCDSCLEALEHFMKCEPIDIVTVGVRVKHCSPECGGKYAYCNKE